MNEWNDDWRDKLKKLDYDCYERLCECRNNKNDIVKIASLMHCYNENKTNGDCLYRTLEWLGEWNGQHELINLSYSEHTRLYNLIV